MVKAKRACCNAKPAEFCPKSIGPLDRFGISAAKDVRGWVSSDVSSEIAPCCTREMAYTPRIC